MQQVVAVAVLSQLAKNGNQRRFPGVTVAVPVASQASEFAQGGAQPAYPHAQLVDGVAVGAATGHVAGVGQNLTQAVGNHGRGHRVALELAAVAHGAGAGGRAKSLAQRQTLALHGLAHAAKPQPVSGAPAGGQGGCASGLALFELQLQFADRPREVARCNKALIQRDLHHRPPQPYQPAQANNVAAVNQYQRRKCLIGFELQCMAYAGPNRHMLVASQIQQRRGLHTQRHVVLQPLQRAASGRFGGLYPLPTFLAQAYDHALSRQQMIWRVEVARQQALLGGLAALHRGLDTFKAGGGNFKFEFELGHGVSDRRADSTILRPAVLIIRLRARLRPAAAWVGWDRGRQLFPFRQLKEKSGAFTLFGFKTHAAAQALDDGL